MNFFRSTSDKQKYKKKNLFTMPDDNDRRSLTFIRAINSLASQNKIIPSESLLDMILRVKYYDDEKKNNAMNYQDIHYEIIDFIIKTALYHRALDAPAFGARYIDYLNLTIDQYINAIFDLYNKNEIIVKDKNMLKFYDITSNNYKSNLSKLTNNILNSTGIYTKNNAKSNHNKYSYSIVDIVKKLNDNLDNKNKINIQDIYNVIYNSLIDFLLALIKEINNIDSNKIINYINKLKLILKVNIKSILEKPFKKQFVLLSNSKFAQNLYENIFKKWETLNDNEKQFYNKYIQVLHFDDSIRDWKILNNIDIQNKKINYDKLRLNLKKTSNPFVTVFENDLPLLSSRSVTFWYTDTNNKLQSVNVYNREASNLLKILYNSIYRGKTVSFNNKKLDIPLDYTNATNLYKKSRDELFSLNVNKIIKNLLLNIENLPSDKINKQILIMNKNCLNYTKDTKSIKCREFIYDCILNDDADSMVMCLNKLKDNEYEKLQREKQNIHPAIALKILYKLGFQPKTYYDNQTQKQIKKIISFDEWIDVIKNQYRDIETKVLENNKSLKNYLNMLISYVNSKPRLLNDTNLHSKIIKKMRGGYTTKSKSRRPRSPPPKIVNVDSDDSDVEYGMNLLDLENFSISKENMENLKRDIVKFRNSQNLSQTNKIEDQLRDIKKEEPKNIQQSRDIKEENILKFDSDMDEENIEEDFEYDTQLYDLMSDDDEKKWRDTQINIQKLQEFKKKHQKPKSSMEEWLIPPFILYFDQKGGAQTMQSITDRLRKILDKVLTNMKKQNRKIDNEILKNINYLFELLKKTETELRKIALQKNEYKNALSALKDFNLKVKGIDVKKIKLFEEEFKKKEELYEKIQNKTIELMEQLQLQK